MTEDVHTLARRYTKDVLYLSFMNSKEYAIANGEKWVGSSDEEDSDEDDDDDDDDEDDVSYVTEIYITYLLKRIKYRTMMMMMMMMMMTTMMTTMMMTMMTTMMMTTTMRKRRKKLVRVD